MPTGEGKPALKCWVVYPETKDKAPVVLVIQEIFGVTAHIVPIPVQLSEVDRLERVALSAARLLHRFVDSTMTVGVAWGSTMSAVSRHLVPKALSGAEVVQLNGAGNTRTTGIIVTTVMARM